MQTFSYLSDQFFSQVYFKFSPTSGTAAGLHQYDAQLEDYSAAGVEREVAALHEFEKKVAAIDPSALDAPAAADREILLNNIRSELLSLEVIRGWEKNPDSYSSGITSSAFVIMERPYAPTDTRLRALVEREKKMPQALLEARKNLKNPPRIFTEIALEQIDGDISFFQNDVPSAFLQRDGWGGDRNRCGDQGGVCQNECGGGCGAEELWRVDEDGPAAALQRRLPPGRRDIPEEAGLRRDGGHSAGPAAGDCLRRSAQEPGGVCARGEAD